MTAALAVFALHTVFNSGRLVGPVFEFTAKYFALSVQLFYLVSAFALMHSTRVYAHQPDWISHFYQKRFWRIAPLFYAIAIVLTLANWLRHDTLPSLAAIALNAIFLNNLHPRTALSLVEAGWSVSVEAIFYMAFPLIFIHIRSLKSAAVLIAVSIVIALVTRFHLQEVRMTVMRFSYADYSIGTNLPYFSMGVFAYLFYDRAREAPWAQPGAKMRIAISVHATFALPIAALLTLVAHFNPWLRAHGRIDQVVWGLIFMLLTTWVTVRPWRILSFRPIEFLGERSYSLYLLHPYLIHKLRPISNSIYYSCEPRMGEWAVAPALVSVFVPLVLLAAASYALIERPGMDFGRWLRQRLKAHGAASPQVAA